MAVPAEQIDRLTQEVVAAYGRAELEMLAKIARALARGLDAPDWATAKLLELQLLRARLSGDLDALAGLSQTEITRAVLSAYNLGQAGAVADLLAAGLASTVAQTLNPALSRHVRTLLAEAAGSILGQHGRILRSVEDAYRRIIRDTVTASQLGALTRREAAQRALDAFANSGISGFTDTGGRRWSMAAYTEMAMRTATQRSATWGHAEALQAHGQDLVVVSDHAGECPACRPWEGKVLSLSGAPRIDGVRTVGTLNQAMLAGYKHPGCRHTETIYLPGITRTPSPQGRPADYDHRQEQRRLERGIRQWKAREQVALDDAARARARLHVREWQARLRDHLAQHPTLKRQPYRESLAAAR